MREALGPFAGILERKINPLLAALEAIPDDVDRFTKVTLPSIHRTLDQPQLAPPPGPRNWPLDITQEAAPLTYLRPPGALPPGQFENVCSRCGKCVEVCPATAIKLDPNQLTADGLPHILARTQSCAVCTSLACMTECPSGALKLVDRLEIDMGTARVDHHLCRRDTGEDCRICIEFCPIVGDEAGGGPDAIVIHPGTGRVSVRKNTCVGCGLCENKCPTEPAAIRVVPARGPAEPIIS
ncbi:MAG TPA: 4Fe-4S dicluster domain-containing protein [Phycisphaerae bacterium]|jgi:ferredoxin-type protein NapG|nr:4Fe-4S dicluster domain-containing protein [Phycisphaerae bacterium]